MLTYPEALAHLLAAAQPVRESRPQPLAVSIGRILAEPQFATVDVPPLDNSAMDGYAVRLADLNGEGSLLKIGQRIAAGQLGEALEPGTAARIFTGAPMPQGADAVVMQEYCEVQGDQVCIKRMPKLGENIRRQGEDMAVNQEILRAGTVLRPQELALAAAAGLPEIPVLRHLRVALFCTGDELYMPGEPLPPGGIYNSNQFALAALLEGLGCEVRNLGRVPDDLEATRAALREAAAGNDLIMTTGGVSVGEEDHIKPAVEAEGRLDMWKVAIKPGKPLAFGQVNSADSSAWFLGLPGNPVSSFVTFLILVRPFIRHLQGVARPMARSYRLPVGFSWDKDSGLHEFLRVYMDEEGRLQQFPHQGSGVVHALVGSDGLAVKPPHLKFQPGDLMEFIPFSEVL